jgi:hypothetical protein
MIGRNGTSNSIDGINTSYKNEIMYANNTHISTFTFNEAT